MRRDTGLGSPNEKRCLYVPPSRGHTKHPQLFDWWRRDGRSIRAHDWSESHVGAPETWPQSLCSALSTCLDSKAVSAIYCGPDFRLFYNDGYRPFLDQRHPWGLGRPMSEIWPTIWQTLSAPAQTVLDTAKRNRKRSGLACGGFFEPRTHNRTFLLPAKRRRSSNR